MDDITDDSVESVIEPLQPIFNWVGSKRKYASRLAKLLPRNYDLDRHTYYEPFLGGGSFLLFLQPRKAIVSDLDKNVVNAFKNVKSNVDEVIKHLKTMYRGDTRKVYEKYCRNFEKFSGAHQTAALIFISKHSFGSNLIQNSQGTGFTLCYRNEKIKTDYDNLLDVSDYLRKDKVTILHGTFQKALKTAKKNDFIFLDPPYIETRITQKQYYNEGTTLDLQSLVDEVLRLHKIGCKVMLINSSSSELKRALKPHFKCIPFKAHETILGAHSKTYSNGRKECIYINYSA